MAREVVIDILARFTDNVTGEAKAASKAMDDVEKEAKEAAKAVDNLGKKKAEPKVDANTTPASQKVSKIDRLLAKLGRSKTEAKVSLLDRATAILNKVTNKVKAFAGKTYSGLLSLRDSKALSTLNTMSSKIKSFTGRTWSAVVKIKDLATAPLRGIKNMLFSIKSLVLAITAGLAAKQFIANPINLADQYSSAQIGFSTLLGESAGQQMMNDLDAFAKATPFKSSEVIGQTQRMIAMGWDAESIIGDMTTIGDAAAATGKGEQGLQQIVTALAQIKTKGRLSTEELNQLAEAGISAKRYLAEGLGYGSGDEGIAKMTEDLEKGAIASGEALEALLSGMQEYKGMMDKTANETVSGLWSQIEDTFEINIFRRWGQGLQDGAKRGFGSIVSLLNEADGALTEFGDTIYEVGKNVSDWLADKFENAIGRITEITDSFEFKEASLGEKVSMLWKGVIADPLKEWFSNLWTNEENIEKAAQFGQKFGETLTKGIMAVLGITDIFDDSGINEESGSNIAQGFAKGFVDGFDVSAISDKVVDAIGNVWGALPTWAKILIGGYGIGKAAGGISSFAGGIANFIGGAKNVIGGFDMAGATLPAAFPTIISSGTGIVGTLGKVGARLGASTVGGAVLAGGLGIAGGAAGAVSLGKGIYDLYGAHKAYKAGDDTEFNAKMASGLTTTSGVAMGAAVGSVFGPLGTLVGAGLGGVAGWFMGGKAADDIRAAKWETEGLAEEMENAKSKEEEAAAMAKAKWENATKHFGDIKLSLAEIERLADQIVWGDDLGKYEKFTSATKQAAASLESMKTASAQVDRWMWKASLGVKFNKDEQESIIASVDEYIASAKAFVENKHYEFTAAVSLLVDVESEEGKSIIDSGNAFYGQLQEQLDGLGSELSRVMGEVLKDGVISTEDKIKIKIDGVEYELNEQEAVTKLQAKIAEITNMVANAEHEAEIELIKIKWGSGNLDYESFDTFMSQMQTTIEERMAANDEAYTASVSSLKLQLSQGAISQEEYDQQLQTLIDGYNANNVKLRAEIRDVELQIIGDAYGDVLGEDAVDDLNKALQYALDNNLDPIEISDQKMAELLHIDLEGNGETISNIRDMLSGVFQQLGLIPVNVDGELYFKATGNNVSEEVEGVVDSNTPDTVSENVTVEVTGEKEVVNPIDILASEFGIEPSVAENVIVKLNGAPSFQNQIDILCQDFGIQPWYAENILWQLSGNKSITNTISLYASDFGIKSSYTFTPTIHINPQKGNVTSSVAEKLLSGGGFRGGIFGGESAMDAFARGGETDNSGIVGGSTRFIRVNEESPEMIIPLSSQRRERALKLWNKTGELLNVPGFARGGNTSGGAEDWSHLKRGGSGEASGGQTVHVDVGGITFQIHVEGGDPEAIAEAIKAQIPELAEMVAGVFNEAFTGQFENTPSKGGAA